MVPRWRTITAVAVAILLTGGCGESSGRSVTIDLAKPPSRSQFRIPENDIGLIISNDNDRLPVTVVDGDRKVKTVALWMAFDARESIGPPYGGGPVGSAVIASDQIPLSQGRSELAWVVSLSDDPGFERKLNAWLAAPGPATQAESVYTLLEVRESADFSIALDLRYYPYGDSLGALTHISWAEPGPSDESKP